MAEFHVAEAGEFGLEVNFFETRFDIIDDHCQLSFFIIFASYYEVHIDVSVAIRLIGPVSSLGEFSVVTCRSSTSRQRRNREARRLTNAFESFRVLVAYTTALLLVPRHDTSESKAKHFFLTMIVANLRHV